MSYNYFLLDNLCEQYCYEVSGLKKFFIVSSVIQCGLLLGTVFVSLFVYKPYMDKLKATLNDKCLDDVDEPYEYRYKLDTKKELNDGLERKLELSFLMEHTPEGNIIMTYSKEDEGFSYWSDKVIPYKYLQSVARKYVIQNHCVELYKGYDYEVDASGDIVDVSGDIVDVSGNEVEEKNNVFASLKKYNKKDSGKKEDIINIEKNKYIHKGKVSEFSLLKNEVKKNEKTFTFADFKNMKV